MKIISSLLVISFLLSGSIALADNEQPSWTDQAEQILGTFNQITSSIVGDTAILNQWAQILSGLIDQQQTQNQSLQQLQLALNTSMQQVNALQDQRIALIQRLQQLQLELHISTQQVNTLQAQRIALIQQIQEIENQCSARIMQGRQEQFDIDGQKAIELIDALKGLKQELLGIVAPARNEFFVQLQNLSNFLMADLQQNAEAALSLICALQENEAILES